MVQLEGWTTAGGTIHPVPMVHMVTALWFSTGSSLVPRDSDYMNHFTFANVIVFCLTVYFNIVIWHNIFDSAVLYPIVLHKTIIYKSVVGVIIYH